MAKKVLAWRADENDNEGNLWERLIEANEEVVRKMLVLHQHHELDGGSELINDIGQMTSNQWDTLKIDCEGEEENMVSVVCELRGSFLTVRKLLKEIGEQAGVPIEPLSRADVGEKKRTRRSRNGLQPASMLTRTARPSMRASVAFTHMSRR